jgi:hypothetical protein
MKRRFFVLLRRLRRRSTSWDEIPKQASSSQAPITTQDGYVSSQSEPTSLTLQGYQVLNQLQDLEELRKKQHDLLQQRLDEQQKRFAEEWAYLGSPEYLEKVYGHIHKGAHEDIVPPWEEDVPTSLDKLFFEEDEDEQDQEDRGKHVRSRYGSTVDDGGDGSGPG